MKRTMLVVALTVAICSTSPRAQSTGEIAVSQWNPVGLPVLSDFRVHAWLDSPTTHEHVSRSKPLILGGWAFECRSGLQPSTQRVGDIAVRFVHSYTGEIISPTSVSASFGTRKDVMAAFGGGCPSLGDRSGLSVTVLGLPQELGYYLVELFVGTFDYAGRYYGVTIRRGIFITQ